MPSRQRLEIIDFHPVATVASFDTLARRQYMITSLMEDSALADLEALSMQTRKAYVSSWVQLWALAIGTTDNSLRTAIFAFLEYEIPNLKLKYELFTGMYAVITGHLGHGALEAFSPNRTLYNYSVDRLYSVFPTDPATVSNLISRYRISLPDHFYERPFLISFSGYIKHQEVFLDMFAGLLPAEHRLKLDKHDITEFNAFCDALALDIDVTEYKNRRHKKNWPWSWIL